MKWFEDYPMCIDLRNLRELFVGKGFVTHHFVESTHLGFGEHTALNCGENHNLLIRQTIGTFDLKEAILIRIVFFVVGDKKVSGAYR